MSLVGKVLCAKAWSLLVQVAAMVVPDVYAAGKGTPARLGAAQPLAAVGRRH